ncbi:MAG: hypothetical protein ACP5KD_09270 [Fervidobacterium sp.]
MRKEMMGAKVWGWGEDPELAGKNAEIYISKKWKTLTKECSITITGKDTREDILFGITTYLSEPKKVRNLVDDLLKVALTGESKLYFITVNLYDYLISKEKVYRNDLQTLRENYKKREQVLTQKFLEHPKVKALIGDGKPLVTISSTNILCELETKKVNKIIVNAGNYDFDQILDSLHRLTNELIKKEIATRILGYDLWNDVEKSEIEDLYVENGKVYLWVRYPVVKR